ncbi:MAG: glycosyltransferase 87 family protein [Pseudolabrys sp.]|nr:glycosyltransferase 87 family protein [Pseudolabrys sp.]
MDAVMRLQERGIAIVIRYPWIGWAAWFTFCVASLLRTHPRRFGSTFQAYLTAAHNFWNGLPIYDMSVLGEYLYWPVSLLVLGPLPLLSPVAAAAIAMTLAALALSIAAIVLMRALLPERPRAEVINLAGILLMINIPAAWYNFKYVQAQIGMTAFMMIAAAAIMRRHWLMACFWLFLSVIIKPLSLVMLLLCGATQPKMRIGLVVALVAALALPFAFGNVSYVAGQYSLWFIKLQQLTSVAPGEWIYQADFATMLDTIGISLPHVVQTAIRLAAALFILALVWRVSRLQNNVVFAIAVTLYAACYITLFGPRNEFLSFLVLTPTLTALAMLLLDRDARDQRAWLLIVAVLVIGFHGALEFDRFVKPLLTFIVLGWMIWMTIEPQRWVALLTLHAPEEVPPRMV